jgi:poly(3-hydroxybutyrate) depolymerase
MNDGDELVRVETLAREFGVTRERVCQLEASAKRKIAMALAQEGYANFAAGAPITLPQNRASRRRTQPALSVTEVAAATG